MSSLCNVELEEQTVYEVTGSKNSVKFHFYMFFIRIIQTTSMNQIQANYYTPDMELKHKDYKIPAMCFSSVKRLYSLKTFESEK